MQPQNLDLINKSLDNKSIALYGKIIPLPDNFDFSNIADNKKFLNALGLDESLANNPDMMKAIARYYYYSAGTSTRAVNPYGMR
jgi:hypothetical protein